MEPEVGEKRKADAVDPKASEDVVEPKASADKVEPKASADVVETKASADVVESKPTADVVEPKASTAAADPKAAGDGAAGGGTGGATLEKKASGSGGTSGSKMPTTPKKAAKNPGGPSKGSSDRKGKAPKKNVDVPNDQYDDEFFDLSRLMNLESIHVSKMNDEQMKRYEYYRRSDLKKEKVKKLLSSMNFIPPSTPPSDPFIIAVKGLAKVFVGEVVETALDIQKEWGESGPLHPKHLREAYRRMVRDGSTPILRRKPGFPLAP